MIAALEPLRTQEVRDLVGAAGQRSKGQFGMPIAAGIDNPQRRAVPAVGVSSKLGIEPVQRPVERYRIGPAKARDGLVVIRPVFQQECAGFLKCRHIFGLWEASSLRGAKRGSNPAFSCGATGLLRCARNDESNYFPANSRTCWMMP